MVELRNDNWREPRVAALVAGGSDSSQVFIYLTVSTALTGKTLGMRILSLRVIDARTGLIPTGTQAAGAGPSSIFYVAGQPPGAGFLMTLGRGGGKDLSMIDFSSRTASSAWTMIAVERPKALPRL